MCFVGGYFDAVSGAEGADPVDHIGADSDVFLLVVCFGAVVGVAEWVPVVDTGSAASGVVV